MADAALLLADLNCALGCRRFHLSFLGHAYFKLLVFFKDLGNKFFVWVEVDGVFPDWFEHVDFRLQNWLLKHFVPGLARDTERDNNARAESKLLNLKPYLIKSRFPILV